MAKQNPHKHQRRREATNEQLISDHLLRATNRHGTAHQFLSPLAILFLFMFFILAHKTDFTNGQQFAQNNLLRPSHNMENLRISEGTPVGTIVHQLRALDPDPTKPRNFSYHISGDYLRVDEHTGDVSLAKALDRERQASFSVVVSVFDASDLRNDATLETRRRTIFVDDVDDSVPTFGSHRFMTSNLNQARAVYQANISELADPKSIVISEIMVTDADEGQNAEVVFECRAAKSTNQACDVFTIDTRRVSSGRYSVSVRTRLPLDYERDQSYKFVLAARGKLPSRFKGQVLESEATILINVLNVQDEGPVFLNAPYTISIPENLKQGTTLLEIQAQDGDAEPQRFLSIVVHTKQYRDYFSIEKKLGENIWYLKSNTTIDREGPLFSGTSGKISIGLIAVEIDSDGRPVATEQELYEALETPRYSKGPVRREEVSISIIDLPDSLPAFSQASTNLPFLDNTLELNITEALTTGSAVPNLDLLVYDRDKGINSRFDLDLRNIDESGPAATDAFNLEPKVVYGRAEVVLTVKNSSLLDYENPALRSYRFNLVATKNRDAELVQIFEVRINVQDANDNVPEFDRDQYVINVDEGTPPGSTVASIRASDRDSGQFGRIDYMLRGVGASKFKLFGSEGRIVVNDCREQLQCLDHELQPHFYLTYEAKDGGGRTKNVSVIINVTDINDHAPKFSESIYKRELISDNMDSKQVFISPQLVVRAKDSDGPDQGTITYRIASSNLTGLEIMPNSGLVYLSGPVDLESYIQPEGNSSRDRDTRIAFEAEVIAEDNGKPKRQSSSAKIILTVKGDRDGAPQFKQQSYQAYVREDYPLDRTFFKVQATDPDDKDVHLRYSLVYDLNDLVAINSSTGDLSFKSPVDYDDFKNVPYNVTVQVADNSKPNPMKAEANVAIFIQDVNNKPPHFKAPQYQATLSQGETRIGEEILQVEATDMDTNSQLIYSIQTNQIQVTDRTGQQFSLSQLASSNSSNYLAHMDTNERQLLLRHLEKLFSINKTTGAIRLESQPDYESVSVIRMVVLVRDINQERSSLSGGLTQSSQLQQDQVDVSFILKAKIDSSPVFAAPWTADQRTYNLSIIEELPVGSEIFHLLAKDPATNKLVEQFEEVSGSDVGDYFSVARNGIVTLKKRIDYEEIGQSKKLAISVKAITNADHFSVAHLAIQIIDLNDNAPQFKTQNYSVSISELANNMTQIVRVYAEDRDSANYSQIYYSLSGYSSDLFSIDSRKGTIRLRKDAKLDRELEATHTLLVTASDCSLISNPRSISNQMATDPVALQGQDLQQTMCKRSSVFVTINLIDENDNEPQFLGVNRSGELEALVAETASVGTVIAQAVARDPDDGSNGQVSYELAGGDPALIDSKLIKIDADGFLSVAGSLAGLGRQRPYRVTVRASDHGQPMSKQSFANVIITIKDVVVNDGVPRILSPRANEEILVSENAAPGSIVFQVRAVDPDDETSSKSLMYRFATPSDTFDLDPFNAIISLKNIHGLRLDRERVPNYTLVLEVTDLEPPNKVAYQVILIKVEDINDNEPYFERAITDPPVELIVEEEVGQDYLVGTIQAIDLDVGDNALIRYEIIDGDTRYFKLSNETATEGNNPCRIYATQRLDREARENYTLVIKASGMSKSMSSFVRQINDRGLAQSGGLLGGSRSHYNASDLSEIKLLIKLVDINDNRPIFERDYSKLVVDSSAEVHSQLMVFRARDDDSSSSEISYSIADVLYFSDAKLRPSDGYYSLSTGYPVNSAVKPISMKHAFDVDIQSGVLRNSISLRPYIDGYFEVYVKADSSGGSQSDLTEGSRLSTEFPTNLQASNDEFKQRCESNPAKENNVTKNPFHELENCYVAISRATVFVTNQRETFKLIFNKAKLNDRLDEFKGTFQNTLESLMFGPTAQASSADASIEAGRSTQPIASSEAKRVVLNTISTDYYEREDGSYDFATLTSCSQLVRFDDRTDELDQSHSSSASSNLEFAPNQVVQYEEVLKLFKSLNASLTTAGPGQQVKASPLAQYGLIGIERCAPDRSPYRLTTWERVSIYLAISKILIIVLLILIASRMRKHYERRLRALQRSKYQYMNPYGPSARLSPVSHPAAHIPVGGEFAPYAAASPQWFYESQGY